MSCSPNLKICLLTVRNRRTERPVRDQPNVLQLDGQLVAFNEKLAFLPVPVLQNEVGTNQGMMLNKRMFKEDKCAFS